MHSNAIRPFRPGWKMTLFAGLLLPVVVSLGMWQLSRAEEKRRFENAYLDRIGALAAPPGAELVAFQRLRLSGEFEQGRDFLLDNQTRNGEIGYGVISVFRSDDGRGWLMAAKVFRRVHLLRIHRNQRCEETGKFNTYDIVLSGFLAFKRS